MKNENRTKAQLLKEMNSLHRQIAKLEIIEIAHNQTERALQESEEKFRVLYESSHDAIMMLAPPTWLFTAGNQATIKMFHAKNEKEFISKEPWELSPKYQPDGQLSSKKAKKMIQKAMETGSNFFEWTHNRINGEDFSATVLLTRIKLKDKQLLQATVRDITERKKIEEELNKHQHQLEKLVTDRTLELIEEKEYYHSFVTSMKDWVWEMDLNGIHTYSNPAVESILGYKVEDVVEHHISELWLENNKTPKYLKSLKKTLSLGKSWKNFAGRFKHKNGSLVYTESTAIPIYNSDNELIGYRGLDHDITKRKKAENELLNRENYLLALYKAKKNLMASDSENSLQQFVDILGPASNASRTYIFINHTNEKGEGLTSQKAEYCAEGINPEIDNPDLQNLKLDNLFERWQKTLSKGEIIVGKIKDFPKGEKEFLEVQDIKAILIIPIITNKEFIGFIGFDNCNSDIEWDSAEQNFLKAAAKDLAQFVERNKSQEQLIAEYNRFQTTMDAMDASVYVADMQTHKLLFSNKAFNNLFGEHFGEKCYSVIQKGQAEPCDFCTNHLLLDEQGNPKKPYVWEFQNTISKLWYQLRDQAIRWIDGRIVRLEIATDISDRKKVEEELKTSEERYKYLFEQSPTSIWEQDFSEVHRYLTSLKKSGIKDFKLYFENHPAEVKQCIEMVRIVDVNETTVSLFNAKHKDDLITNLNLILTEDSLSSFIGHLCSIAENKIRYNSETINKTLDGKLMNVFIKIYVVPGYEKDYSRVLVSLMDITGQKKAETMQGNATLKQKG